MDFVAAAKYVNVVMDSHIIGSAMGAVELDANIAVPGPTVNAEFRSKCI